MLGDSAESSLIKQSPWGYLLLRILFLLFGCLIAFIAGVITYLQLGGDHPLIDTIQQFQAPDPITHHSAQILEKLEQIDRQIAQLKANTSTEASVDLNELDNRMAALEEAVLKALELNLEVLEAE